MSEIEGKSIKELGEWLANVKKVEEDVILTLEEAEIDGALFLQLKVDDLQDLFKSFVKRKKIRDIIRQVQEKEEPEEDIPVPFQPSRFSSPIASGPSSSPIPPKFSPIPSCSSSESFSILMSPSRDTSPSSGNIKVPISQILENPGEYCSKDIEMERAKIVRQAMDSMVVGCEGRPNESTILMMAKAMALKYPVLRDSRDGPLKDNYVIMHDFLRQLHGSLKGFLRRRMYNTTAATTNRGRKRKRDSVDSEKDSSCVSNLNESSLGSITNESIAIPIDVDLPNTLACRDIAVVSNGGDTEKDVNPNSEQEHIEKGKKSTNAETQETVAETPAEKPKTMAETPAETPKRAEEVLMKEIKSMTKDSNKNDVFQLLNLTMAKRNADQEGMSVRLRFENLRENYKIFLNSKFIIQNLLLQLPNAVNLDAVKTNLLERTEELLDYIFSKGLIKAARSVIKSEDQKIMTAMVHLPVIMGKPRASSEGVKLHNTLVHVSKTDETVKDVGKKHKGCNYPWILFHKMGDQINFLVMIKDQLYVKAKSAFNAICIVMGLYYAAVMPYPSILNGSLLFIQKEILGDYVHDNDQNILTKLMKDFNKFKEESKNIEGLEGLF